MDLGGQGNADGGSCVISTPCGAVERLSVGRTCRVGLARLQWTDASLLSAGLILTIKLDHIGHSYVSSS